MGPMANELITPTELAVWTQTPQATIDSDPFAAEVMSKVSSYIKFLAGRDGTKFEADGVTPVPEWTYDSAPFDVKMIVLWMCKRTYVNPDQETSSGVGPIRSTVLDAAALGMALTDEERKTVLGYRVGGAPTDLWVLTTTRGSDLPTDVLYLPDDQQVGLAESADPRPWMIPMFHEDDPGGTL